MDGLLFRDRALVVIGAIVMGTKSSGVALGIWGRCRRHHPGVRVRARAGLPPIDAILIILR
jgi:anaerobic C4-dicarboxylate transporter DcuA/anaerobic C4-dicarboxylate transporter DcuB